ncbi:MAG: ribonuclease P protein component [candidate division Zixibacteria bacterium]|nr:ribonuclease P protein component [candidate division Zixibacteria bacterium]MBU1470163.1 ribonuclease P protein component [candidate division Zixibacteria bacterium]MBU2625994.1 ribonuclease P protein component [candidate division Zixibacteria bacterium]
MCRRKLDNIGFGRECRLKSDIVIREVARSGKRFSGQFLNIKSRIYDDTLRQFCIRTPRSSGNAVQRNRIKRIIRETLRLNMDKFKQGTRAVIWINAIPSVDPVSGIAGDISRFLDHA